MKEADAAYEEGMRHVGMSRHADYHSEYVGDLEGAVACFERALALVPDHAGALAQKGIALAGLHRHQEAATTLAEAIRFMPGDADLWLERGKSLAVLARHEEALGACDETLRLRPDDIDAQYLRAGSLDALRRDADALAAWSEFLGLPDTRTINHHGARVRLLTKDFRRMRAALARAGALARLERPEAVDAYRALIDEGTAREMLVAEDFSAALAAHEAAHSAYQAYMEQHAADSLVWRLAGENYLRARRTADALAAYERAIALAPRDADAWIGKAEALVQSGRRIDSLDAFREALRVKPGYLAASGRLARVQKEIGRAQSDAKRFQ